MLTESVPSAGQQVPQDPCRVAGPLGSAKRTVPDAAIDQRTCTLINSGITRHNHLDAPDAIAAAGDAVELLGVYADADQCAMRVIELCVDDFCVARPRELIGRAQVIAVWRDAGDAHIYRERPSQADQVIALV